MLPPVYQCEETNELIIISNLQRFFTRKPPDKIMDIRYHVHMQAQVNIRFYEELKDFLLQEKQKRETTSPKIKKYYNISYLCGDGRKIYWQGSHYLKMQKMIHKTKDVAG